MVHQGMQVAIHSLNWGDLSRGELRAWQDYVEANIAVGTDHVFPARSAATQLMNMGSRRAKRAVFQAYRRGQTLWLAPLVIGSSELTKADAAVLIGDVVAASDEKRKETEGGRYGLGGNTGALLGYLAYRYRTPELFDAMDRFTSQVSIPLFERVAAVEPLIEHPDVVPGWLKAKLARGLAQSSVDLPLFEAAPVELANVRLRAVFGTARASEVISVLLPFANDARAELRITAAHAAADLAIVAPTAICTIVLSLAHDVVPGVRAAAGTALASIAPEDAELDESRRLRLVGLLQESGETVPRAVWHAMADQARAGRVPGEEFVQLATQVAEHHVAYTVRAAAQRLVTSLLPDADVG